MVFGTKNAEKTKPKIKPYDVEERKERIKETRKERKEEALETARATPLTAQKTRLRGRKTRDANSPLPVVAVFSSPKQHANERGPKLVDSAHNNKKVHYPCGCTLTHDTLEMCSQHTQNRNAQW